MPKIRTPASIIYEADGIEQEINFHAVVSEDHSTSSVVTKYPVQTGVHISTHSIRNNREVKLSGVITDSQFGDGRGPAGSEVEAQNGVTVNYTDYGKKAAENVKKAFDRLIQSGTECKVVTNLGIYEPVIFTMFQTQQSAGKLDSMHFMIGGEEIVKVSSDTKSAPKPINFVEIFDTTDRKAAIDLLYEVGVEVDDCDSISRSRFTVGEDFILQDVDEQNKRVETTYEYVGTDSATGNPQYKIIVSRNSVESVSSNAANEANDPCKEESYLESLKGGIAQIPARLGTKLLEVSTDIAEEYIHTAMGALATDIRGVFYDTVTMDSKAGTLLVKAGVSTIIKGVTGNKDDTFFPGESLPRADQIIEGLQKGFGIGKPDNQTVTLLKLKCACVEDQREDIATEEVPIIDR